MNAEIKSQWLDALRSGKYTQGQYALRETAGEQVTHCCLGVLCDIAAAAGVVKANEQAIEEDGSLMQTIFDGNAAFLPESVQSWAGIRSADGRIENEDPEYDNSSYATLTGMNDNEHSFNEIANVIERHF